MIKFETDTRAQSKNEIIYRLTPWTGVIHEQVAVARVFEAFQAFTKPKFSVALQLTILNRKRHFIDCRIAVVIKVKGKDIPARGRGGP
jgi:non-canonical (house-cleaning) NTP pyrophosphatase